MDTQINNCLYYGDCLDVLRSDIAADSIDLVYIDPPFNIKRDYNKIYNNADKGDIMQTNALYDTWRWTNQSEEYLAQIRNNPDYSRKVVETALGFERILGRGGMLAYLIYMIVRLAQVWKVMKKTGSLYLHCDAYAGHYLKIACDSIFLDKGGEFRNQIAWCYTYGGVSNKNWARKHDMILYYTKSKRCIFNLQKIKVYDSPNIHVTSGKNMPVYEDEKGKYELENELNWWQIGILSENSKERMCVGTQKPERLLEKIISASTNEGDVVMDCFCGCGTAMLASQSLGRKWVGIDISYNSISSVLEKFDEIYGAEFLNSITIRGIPYDIESARYLAHKKDDRMHREFEKWAILTYTNHHAKINDSNEADKSMDGVAYVMGGRVILSVKSGKIGMAAVRELHGAVERERSLAGVLLTLEEPTISMQKEAAKLGSAVSPNGILMPVQHEKLQIITIRELMAGARINFPLQEAVTKMVERTAAQGRQEEFGI